MNRRSRRAAPAYLRGAGPDSANQGIVLENDSAEIHYRSWDEHSLVQIVQLELFPEAPELVVPCAVFLLERGLDRRPTTRQKYPSKLRYFSRFLLAYGSSYGFRVTEYHHISSRLMAEYLRWLRGGSEVRPKVKKEGRLSKITVANLYNIVKDLVTFIKNSERFKCLLPQNVIFDLSVADKAYKDISNIPGLDESSIVSIRQACFLELSKIFDDLKKGRQILSDDHVALPNFSDASKAFKDVSVCLKAYHQLECQGITSRDIRCRYSGLARALRGAPYHRLGDILRMLHFTRRTLVPAAVILQMHFAFEPDTLIRLNWSEEKDSFLFGNRRGNISGTKYRGTTSTKTKSYIRNDAREFSPAHIMRMLRMITPVTASKINGCDRIFSYVRDDGSFGFFKDSDRFQKVLDEFIKLHNLPHFTLSNLRKTGADLIAKVSDGDLAEQKQFLQHKTVKTTVRSYQSESSIRSREDRLAHGVNVRTRCIKSGNRIDPRGANLNRTQLLAATIGFYCLDPYGSPKHGQVMGRLCSAYGGCPSCPLASINHASARDYARLIQLRQSFEAARLRVDPARWIAKWAPELRALETLWLPAFSAKAVAEAMTLVLPSIPDVE